MAKILVVEDDPIIAKTMRIVLTSANHDIEVCHNTIDGMAYLEQNTVDLLITDVSLPGESGVILLGKVREKFAGLKVMVMSGSQASLDEATAMGADLVLEKPFASDQLMDEIAKLIGGAE